MKIEELKSMIAGTVVTRADPAHGATSAALQWNGRKQTRQPLAIVTPATVADVQTTVLFAAEYGLRVSPRGAGHNLSGIALQDSLVLDLSRLNSLWIDAENAIAEVGPALTNGTLAEALTAAGFAFPLGHCASVPMSGYLLGGGLGWNSGTWGFACSRVDSLDVVMPDGALRRVSAESWPDVYWAARGAGPEFFGVVVRYRLRLDAAPVAMMSAVQVFPMAQIAAVERWMDGALAAFPRNVDFALDLSNVPHPQGGGHLPVVAGICVVYGESEASARRIHAEIAALAPTGAMAVVAPAPVSFAALYAQTGAAMPEGKRYLIDSFWADARADDMVTEIAKAITATPSALSHAIVTRYSAERPALPDAAFSMAAPVWASVCAVWDEASQDAVHVGWLRATADAIGTAAQGHYVGEADLERPGRLEACYTPAALGRLRAMQQLYDPRGIFRRPATTALHAIAAA